MAFIIKSIPFMRYGKITTAVSLLSFIAAVFFLCYNGLNLSTEFTGGTQFELHYANNVNLTKIRTVLANTASIQQLGSGNTVIIKVSNRVTQAQLTALLSVLGGEIINKEYIGPQIGSELIVNSIAAVILLSIGIIAYLAMRFNWRFALAAIIANLHDVVLILGCFAAFRWEFSITVLAAILAVLGYSVNESVVVFDRIRENLRKMPLDYPIISIIDDAINATMNRTIITHSLTEMMVLSILLFGGNTLHYFAIALSIGIVFGIYSSVLLASPLLLLFRVARQNSNKKKVISGIVV